MQVTVTFEVPDDSAAAQAWWANVIGQHSAVSIVTDTGEPVPTARQVAAAKARAAKADKKPGPVEAVLGPEPNGADQAEDDDLGLTDPNMSPAEAKEAGLALVREVYAAGKVQQVKALQKEWQVAKFYDVPQEQGHAFYQRVVKMAVETGVRK